MNNGDIANLFDEIADLLELQNANPFRVRAYRTAARTLQGLGRDVAAMVEAGEDVRELPRIGVDLAEKITDIVEMGTTPMLEELRAAFPPGLVALTRLPGLGPKRVRLLHDELGVNDTESLRKACDDGRIHGLKGFGAKTEAHIREALEAAAKAPPPQRMLLAVATPLVEEMLEYLRAVRGVQRAVAAGSYRRGRETVGDIDLLVTAGTDSDVIDRFTVFPAVAQVVSHGTTRATVVLHNGLQVDLRVVPDESYGAALHYFTGSKDHNVVVRHMAQQLDRKVNEYGVFEGETRIAGETEESVFAAIGLPWIPPELRENRGEFEAARDGRLPRLIEASDIRGELHAHTVATDGRNTIREMAEAARARGLEYLAITDHSKRLTFINGLDADRLLRQCDEVARVDEEVVGISLLKGIEVDILEDGSLDLPDEVLARLDFVIASVHGAFDLGREKQTKRILRALDNRYVTLLGHPTGRKLPDRPSYDVDVEQIVRHAAQRKCFLEVNSQPQRLDLADIYCQMARDEGVLLCLDTDTHSVKGFDNLRYGLAQARRGWLTADDVANTRPLDAFRELVAAARL